MTTNPHTILDEVADWQAKASEHHLTHVPPELAAAAAGVTVFDGDTTGDPEEGNCFLTAAALVLDVPQFALGMVVHGTPVGTGPANKGRRYWHAWVEYHDAGRPMVADFSNGHRTILSRDQFYECGQITGTKVHRYNAAQARRLMAKTGTFGPWVTGWETLTIDGEPVL